MAGSVRAGDEERDVLVALWPHPRDRRMAADRGWYRIRPGAAVDRMGDLRRFRTLAFYQPDAFGKDGRCVRYQAPVLGYDFLPRVEILPEEPDHPNADARYHCFRLGQLEALARPITSRRGRRILFVPTTRDRLERAAEINELFAGTPIEERMFSVLREDGLWPEREYFVEMRRPEAVQYATSAHLLDMAIFCRDRNLDVECDGDTWHLGSEGARRDRQRDNLLEANGWHILRFNTHEILRETPTVLTRIHTAINRYGGVEDAGGIRRYLPDGTLGPAQQVLPLFE